MNLADRARGDLARLFRSNFAEPLCFEQPDGRLIQTFGVWKEGDELVEAGDYLSVSSSAPEVLVLRADFTAVPGIDGSRVCYRGEWFRVADVQHVHPGMYRVRLHREQI
jgi:hypothetical protein